MRTQAYRKAIPAFPLWLVGIGMLFVLIACTSFAREGNGLISLQGTVVIDESSNGSGAMLFDEQDMAGDPLSGSIGHPTQVWFPGWEEEMYPASCYLDLGRGYRLSHVFLHDLNGEGEFEVYGGFPGNWKLLFVDGLPDYQAWNKHTVSVETRYLRFVRKDVGANVAEVKLYGTALSPNDQLAPAKVEELQIEKVTDGSIDLSWKASGDDGLEGRAFIYDLRFSMEPITEMNFDKAKQIHGIDPVDAGQRQAVTVDGLGMGAPYYFALKVYDDALNASAISYVNGRTNLEIGGEPRRLFLTREMLLNESAQGEAFSLIDEQVHLDEKAYSPSTVWDLDAMDWMYPGYAMLDLGTEYQLSELSLYEMGIGTEVPDSISFFVGKPFEWEPLVAYKLKGEEKWKEFDVSGVITRYVRVCIHGPGSRIGEVSLTGVALKQPEQQRQLAKIPMQQPTMDQFIGVNAFVDDPLGRLEASGFVREYHNWMWNEGNLSEDYKGYPNNEIAFEPAAMGWDFDRYYANLSGMGLMVAPDIKQNTLWMAEKDYGRLVAKPVTKSSDPLDPFSYEAHAGFLFQYGARYGQNKHKNEVLKLAGDQGKLTGMNLVRYYENWNEHDRWWMGRGEYFTPYEFAAMCSADYDGHKGAIGSNVGLKVADPSAKMIMSGLARPEVEHLKAVKLWSDYYRGGSVPFDVINIHHYSNSSGVQHGGDKVYGISPEDDDLKGRMERFVQYRDEQMPGKELWITEFGYDTHPESPQGVPEIGSFSREEVQAQWIVRSYLELAASGIDRAAMYMLRDVDPHDPTQYSTSGLTECQDSSWRPKASWFYVSALRNRLWGMVYDQEVEIKGQKVKAYRFTMPNGRQSAYVLWSPTSEAVELNGVQLPLLEGEKKAGLVRMKKGDVDGQWSDLTVLDGQVMVDVGERPVIIMVTDGRPVVRNYPLEEKVKLVRSMLSNPITGLKGAEALVDEQSVAGDAKNNAGGLPTTIWTPGWSEADYPATIYVDLGTVKEISKVYFMDMEGEGRVSVSAGEPDNWRKLFEDPLNGYQDWNAHVVNVKTRYLKITLHEPGSNISELVLYEKK